MKLTKLTKQQQMAVARLSGRYDKPYKELRREVVSTIGFDSCVMINIGHMWLGIEEDGYTHS